MKNKKEAAALALLTLLAAVPTSQAIAMDDHNGMDNQITSADWAHLDGVQSMTGATQYDVAYNPWSNYGCANIGCADIV